ncbi:hypothetical protein [Mesorhizobium huakuii]|uniref:Uncharacterized protein n=1 Tax=Mesorhizobium huakuii TaxID=28104 RepID=A0A7G6T6E6_9HYPH|nr:hypothetical protein [Mesorhizobium huakuii]QND62328.1 hypothetical protein HB778_40740 [Mesorhizobium huakuii]QND69581.1 hypothetical protein HB777_38975 [Mesorhizobium loti]
MSKQAIGFLVAGILIAETIYLAVWRPREQPNPSSMAAGPVSQDDAAKAASRAMTFSQPKEPKK